MSYQTTVAPQANRVRWSFGDLVMVGVVTIGLAAAMLLLLRVPALFGIAVADAIQSRPLVAGMLAGGVIYGIAVVATYLIIVQRKRGSWRELGFRAPALLPMLLTPVIFAVQMAALIIVNLTIMALVGEFENPQVAALTDPAGFSWLNFAIVFFVGAIVAPIIEELIFRGLIYQWLRARGGVVLAVLASAALFSVVHFVPILLPALFAVGVILALAFEWSGSLWMPITLHFMQNALGITAIFVIQANPQLLPQA